MKEYSEKFVEIARGKIKKKTKGMKRKCNFPEKRI